MFEFIKRWRMGKQYGYETLFKGQDTRPVGKVGVLMTEIGMPETYEFGFYRRYMGHVFSYVLPPFVRRIVLADRGIVLLDPENPLSREPFKPQQLIDCHGSFTNREGKPYVECDVTWRPPGMKKDPWDFGNFLYRAEGKSGHPDVCEKTGAKVIGWYYGTLLPEKKVPWRYQMQRVYTDSVAKLSQQFPQTEFTLAFYTDPESMRQAAEELINKGCNTIVCQSFCNPVYSDFEEYAYAFPLLHRLVGGRAKVIFADQLGNQPALKEAYLQIIEDQLAKLPSQASVFLILSTHGHPFKKETLSLRAPEYRLPLEREIRRMLETHNGRWEIAWSEDEYADAYWDPKNTKVSTLEAYQRAIAKGYDYALEIPVEFLAENTDTMIHHGMKKFPAFADYDLSQPIPYPDWDQPLVRTFHNTKTTGIYASCPVGVYRRRVTEAVVSSVGSILAKKAGP